MDIKSNDLKRTIDQLNLNIQHETTALQTKDAELKHLDTEKTALEMEINAHNQEIVMKTNDIAKLKKEVADKTRKLSENQNVHLKLQQEIKTAHSQMERHRMELTKTTRDMTDAMKKAQIK